MNQDPKWKKSSFSGQETDCVEVAGTLGEVRDSKNTEGPTLKVPSAAFLKFVRTLKSEDEQQG